MVAVIWIRAVLCKCKDEEFVEDRGAINIQRPLHHNR